MIRVSEIPDDVSRKFILPVSLPQNGFEELLLRTIFPEVRQTLLFFSLLAIRNLLEFEDHIRPVHLNGSSK
jgi:hypothetical protein